jgi:hypothetical protein
MTRGRHTGMPVEEAREKRRQQLEMLAQLESGVLHVRGLLRRTPDALNNCTIYDVLIRCPRLGRKSVRLVLEKANVFSHTSMVELTSKERRALLSHLPANLK